MKGFCHAIYWKWKEIRTEEEVEELFLGGEDQINWVIGTLDESKLWAQRQNSVPKTLPPSSSQICKYLFMPHTSLFLFLCQNCPLLYFCLPTSLKRQLEHLPGPETTTNIRWGIPQTASSGLTCWLIIKKRLSFIFGFDILASELYLVWKVCKLTGFHRQSGIHNKVWRLDRLQELYRRKQNRSVEEG